MKRDVRRDEINRIDDGIKRCRKCRLCRKRLHAVPGEGPADARVLFVGEAPGKEEDLRGRPFVGRSGRFLDGLLESVNLPRSEIFITSAVKCRPPKNRAPHQDELKICKRNWLDRQIAIINPKIVVLLGRIAIKQVLAEQDSLSRLHGRVYKKDGRIYFATFHPAAGMRFSGTATRIRSDFRKLKTLSEQAPNYK